MPALVGGLTPAEGFEVRGQEPEIGPAPDHVCRRLGMQEGEQAAVRRWTYFVNDTVIRTVDTTAPLRLVRGSAWMQDDRTPENLTETLASPGHTVSSVVDELRPRLTQPVEATRRGPERRRLAPRDRDHLHRLLEYGTGSPGHRDYPASTSQRHRLRAGADAPGTCG
ncbi:UTRA domain-containing protein [Streptomyces sp. NPDC087422]|uniref:UTRA domain-containing protein n=1 Tax=Streptomyces sp. NPDC087422 TaxID=3365786 RepID=UPI0038079391